MPYDKLVDSAFLDNGLKQIADSIRAKTGTEDELVFPTGMSEAIDGISGGDTGDAYLTEEQFAAFIEQKDDALITNLPNGITIIGSYAFYNGRNIAVTEIPSTVSKIDTYAFFNCTKLSEITFKAKSSSIASNAFYQCLNITVINVPWAEGEVANAPWGATNATINYNYVEE